MKTQEELIALYSKTCIDEMPYEPWWGELQPEDKEYMRRLAEINQTWWEESIGACVRGTEWREGLSKAEAKMVSGWDYSYVINMKKLLDEIAVLRSVVK